MPTSTVGGFTSFLRWVWIYFVGTLTTLLSLALWPLFNPWLDRKRRVAEWLNHCWGVGVLWAFPGIHIEVTGREHLANGRGPYILCANHQSVGDIIMLLAAGPTVKFIARRAIFLIPMIGLSMFLAGYVIAGTDRTIDRAVRWIKEGCHVLTFPEGTRSPDLRLLRFGQGAFVLARQAGADVVPVAISGTHELLAKGAFTFHPAGQVRIQILEPIKVEGDPKRIAATVRARIQAAIDGQNPPTRTAVA